MITTGYRTNLCCKHINALTYIGQVHDYYWGEPEQVPHWTVYEHWVGLNILYVTCMDCDNDKIRLKSHSSFMNVLYVTCMDGENDRIQCKNGE